MTGLRIRIIEMYGKFACLKHFIFNYLYEFDCNYFAFEGKRYKEGTGVAC